MSNYAEDVSAFIPCGDSMEKIQEIDEAALESVSGGLEPIEDDSIQNETMMIIPII